MTSAPSPTDLRESRPDDAAALRSSAYVPFPAREAILRSDRREIDILVAGNDVTITHARYAAGERVAGPHIHHAHTDAFYVLEGELTFAIGREAETIAVSAGAFVAAPRGVAHSFRTGSSRPARWLTIHAPDGGFAEFMRGERGSGGWDIAAVPGDGGLPAGAATVSARTGGGRSPAGGPQYRLRCARPDLHVVEWRLPGRHPERRLRRRGSGTDSFFVIEGELEATVGGTRRIVGPGTLISVPGGMGHAFGPCGREDVRLLALHTPASGRQLRRRA